MAIDATEPIVWRTYYEPLIFDEKKIIKYNLLPFTYRGKNLIALRRKLTSSWDSFCTITDRLTNYAYEVTEGNDKFELTKENDKIDNNDVFKSSYY